MFGHAAQQHACQMFLCRRGRLHVVIRREVKSADCGIDIAVSKRSFGLSRANRRIADAEVSQPNVGKPFAIRARAGCETDDGVIAMAARKFGKSDSRVFMASRYPDRREHVVRDNAVSNRPLKKSCALIVRLPLGPVASISPSSASRHAGNSAAGSANAMEPPIVPRLRMAG